MSKQETIRKMNLKFMKKQIPVIKAGYTVKVTTKFKEGDKERTQSFEGLVIKVNGKYGDINSTITVRKISEGIGVEKIFPIHSPNVVDIQIIKIAKVRRSKLYYMRDRFGKSARLQELRITQGQRDKLSKSFDMPEEGQAPTEEAQAPKDAPVAEKAPEVEASKETDATEKITATEEAPMPTTEENTATEKVKEQETEVAPAETVTEQETEAEQEEKKD